MKRSLKIWLLFLVLITGLLPLTAFAQENSREKLNFNQGWKFIRGNIQEAIQVDYPMEELERWESVNPPHTVREEPYINSGGINYQGEAMYRKHFKLSEDYEGKKIFIEFEGVMGVTDVWVNGEHLQGKMAAKTGENTQYGGYLPFILDVTDVVHCDDEYNVITVLTDNSDDETVPPGKPQAQLDFTYFGGIYRNVWLEATDPVHITDAVYEDIVAGGGILVEYPQVSKESATVSVQTHVRNESDEAQEVTLKTQLADADGNIVQTQSDAYTISGDGENTFQQELIVSNPNLWNLDRPYLYKLISTVLVDGRELDCQETKIGIRKITMNKDTGLLINGEHVGFLSGVNRHQEYPYVGYAASSNMQRRDAIKFKNAGFHIVRTSHTVQSIDFIEACDELGILVMECVPGWQHWSSDERFAARVKNDIRQMVRRTRNHPSILCYEISLNESPGVPSNFTNECNDIAKEEHPDLFTSAENPHNGANSDILYGTPSEVAEWSDTAMSLIREYADYWDEQNGNFTDHARVTRGPGTFYPGGEGAMLIQAQNALWNGYTFVGTGGISLSEGIQNYVTSNHRFIGVEKWIGIDHNRGYHSTMSPCGVWDLMRLPKYMYYAYESQRPLEKNAYLEEKGVDTGASIFIASSWSEQAPEVDKMNRTIGTDEKRIIHVYSNADKMRLSVIGSDGETLWTATQDPYEGGTASYLEHPPFIFEEVPYTQGSYLKAEGLSEDGQVLMSQERHTAGEPTKVKLEADFCGMDLVADGSDQVMVYAYVLDEEGNLCQDADNKLYFSVEGEASIVGDGDKRVGSNPINAESGITGIMLRSTKTAGEVKIKVRAEGLEEQELTIQTVPLTQKTVEYEEIAQGPSMEYRSMYLTEKEEILEGNDMPAITKGDVTVGDTTYENSIQVKNMVHINYDLAGKYSRFTATAALEDASLSPNGAVFKVYTDGTLCYMSQPVTAGVADIDIDVTGCETLTLVAQDVSGINTGKMLWLSPYVYEGSTPVDESELKENLALGKSASASSSDEGTSPDGAVDGSMDTLWRSGEAVTEGASQSWIVDLESPVDIRNVKLAVEQDYLKCTYQIYTSSDSDKWELQVEGSKTAHANDVEDIFTAQDVRYLKVEFTNVESTQGEGDGREPKASIIEFEVYPDKGVETVTDYNLKGIEIAGKDFAFSPAKTQYELALDGFEKGFYVRVLPANPESTVTINGKTAPEALETDLSLVRWQTTRLTEDQTIVVEVTSPDGKGKKAYTFRFIKNEEEEETYDAVKAFVPGVNGANQWSYQVLNKSDGSIQDLVNDSFTCVQGENAWSAEAEWLYSGPRYMHPRDDMSAVRTFTVPKDGIIRYQAKIEKFANQPGQVSFVLQKDGVKIWPSQQKETVVNAGDVLEIDLQIVVKAGEQLQLVMDSYGSNAGDATGVLTIVSYPEHVALENAEIEGPELLLRRDEEPMKAALKVKAQTELGQEIEGLTFGWQIKSPAEGISISPEGVLTVENAAGIHQVTVQALYQDEVIAEKTLRLVEGEETWLSDLEWEDGATCGGGMQLQKDHSVDGNPLRLADESGEPVTYEKGIGTHAPSKIVYNIEGKDYDVFYSRVGIDYEKYLYEDGADAKVSFQVYFDGEEDKPAYDSGEMIYNTSQREVCIPIPEDAKTITLYVDAGEVDYSDHADWADARFIRTKQAHVEALEDMIVLAEEKLTGDYEEELLYQLKEAIALAQTLTQDRFAVQEEVDQALADLQAICEELAAIDEQREQDRLAAEAVEQAIRQIGEVSLASQESIWQARAAYEALTETQKQLVENLADLENAEAAYEKLLEEENAYQQDKKAADAVQNQIDTIGTVTLEKGEQIQQARAAYEALTETQKEMVDNLQFLINAELHYQLLLHEEIDTTILQAAIEAAQKLDEETYTEESFAQLEDALEAAKEANLENQEEIDQAVERLLEAICQLKVKEPQMPQRESADLTALQEAIGLAEQVDDGKYTAASVQTLDYILAAARELILSNPTRELQSLVDRLNESLRKAIDHLQLLPASEAVPEEETKDNNQNQTEGTTSQGQSPDTENQDGQQTSGAKLRKGEVYKVGKLYYKVLSDGKVSVLKPAKKTYTSVTIPAAVKINGITCKVTEISKKAFKDNKKLRKVTIGSHVEKIGKKAFYGDRNLKHVVIKSKKLKKAYPGSMKGISSKAVIRVPKGKVKGYKKLFSIKGNKITVKAR